MPVPVRVSRRAVASLRTKALLIDYFRQWVGKKRYGNSLVHRVGVYRAYRSPCITRPSVNTVESPVSMTSMAFVKTRFRDTKGHRMFSRGVSWRSSTRSLKFTSSPRSKSIHRQLTDGIRGERVIDDEIGSIDFYSRGERAKRGRADRDEGREASLIVINLLSSVLLLSLLAACSLCCPLRSDFEN
jgi:hypothetical protein